MNPTNNPTPTPTPNPVPTPNPTPATTPTPTATPTEPAQTFTQSANPVTSDAMPEPVAPIYRPGNVTTMGATEPITEPEPLPEPDPVEEALKAPFKAADPVPGSIGSAVSMPGNGPVTPAGMSGIQPEAQPMMQQVTPVAQPATAPTTPSVAPTQSAAPQMNPSMPTAAPAKKSNKATLILLCIISALIIGVLVVVLIMQLSGNSDTANNTSTSTAKVEETPDTEVQTAVVTDFACKRVVESANYQGFLDGVEAIRADFSDGTLTGLGHTTSYAFDTEANAESAATAMEQEFIAAYQAEGLTDNPFSTIFGYGGITASATKEITADQIDDITLQLLGLENASQAQFATIDESGVRDIFVASGYICEESEE